MRNLRSICEKTITTGFYFLFLLVPLIFTPWTRELFEFPKTILVYVITIVITAAFAIKSVANGKLSIAKTPLDKPILAFLIIYFTSTLLSIDRYTSIFGYYTRFNGGLLSIVCFIFLFYILIGTLRPRHSEGPSESEGAEESLAESRACRGANARISNKLRDSSRTLRMTMLRKLIFCILISSFLISVWGILEHFGIDKNYWKQNVQARVFSTLGQPNWLASYLVAIIPIPLSLILSYHPIPETPSNKHKSRTLPITNYQLPITICYLLFTTAYAAIWFTYSLSGLLGLLTALTTFFILTPKTHLRKKWKLLTALAVICLTISFSSPGLFLPRIKEALKVSRLPQAFAQEEVNTLSQSLFPKALELGGRTGRIRLIVWKGAIDLIFSNLKTALIGTGPETFAYAFLPYRPKELNQTIEWDFLYNKAHNEYLNLGTCIGLLGLGGYLWFIVKFIRFSLFVILNPERQLKGEESLSLPEQLPGLSETSSGILRSAQDDGKDNLLKIGIFSGWISLLVTSFFGFHVVATSLLFWLYPTIIFAQAQNSQKSKIKSLK